MSIESDVEHPESNSSNELITQTEAAQTLDHRATRAFAALMSIDSEAHRPSKKDVTTADAAVITQAEAAKAMGVSLASVKREKAKIKGKKKPASPQQSENGEAIDDMGYPVPKTALPYWNRKPEAKMVLGQISAARNQVRKLLPDDPMWADVNLNGVLADLSSAINRFSAAVPSYVCPYCKGNNTDSTWEIARAPGVNRKASCPGGALLVRPAIESGSIPGRRNFVHKKAGRVTLETSSASVWPDCRDCRRCRVSRI